jgi:hypothetical protein
VEAKIRVNKRLLLEHGEAVEGVLRRAVNHALLMHKRAGNPIATWRNGKVVLIPPDEIEVSDDTPTNGS